MKILLLWDYYDTYLRYYYSHHAATADLPYAEQLEAVLADFFHWPAYLLPHLRAMGHEATIVVGNSQQLQGAWSRAHGVRFEDAADKLCVVAEQVRRFRPDILWLGGTPSYLGEFVREVKPYCGRVMVWIAAAWAKPPDLRGVDCVLTSHACFADQFERLGRLTERILPCFDEAIIQAVGTSSSHHDISFVGTLSTIDFSRRLELLSLVKSKFELRLFSEKPVVRRRPWPVKTFVRQMVHLPFLASSGRRPAVYGLDMFRTLHSSRITLNVHSDATWGTAGNIRLFETTGAGSLLITDPAPNLGELFRPGDEVVTFKDPRDLLGKIEYYLNHEDERLAIAEAGQRRVLQRHNSRIRASEVARLFERYLRNDSLRSQD